MNTRQLVEKIRATPRIQRLTHELLRPEYRDLGQVQDCGISCDGQEKLPNHIENQERGGRHK